jgi:hypothetical protein
LYGVGFAQLLSLRSLLVSLLPHSAWLRRHQKAPVLPLCLLGSFPSLPSQPLCSGPCSWTVQFRVTLSVLSKGSCDRFDLKTCLGAPWRVHLNSMKSKPFCRLKVALPSMAPPGRSPCLCCLCTCHFLSQLYQEGHRWCSCQHSLSCFLLLSPVPTAPPTPGPRRLASKAF